MYTQIGNELETLISSLIPTTKINVVYNYDETNFEELPAITISPLDSSEILYATDANDVDIVYRVRLVDQGKNKAVMEQRVRGIADTLLLTLRQNGQLNGAVCKFDIDVLWGWVNDEQPMRSFDINLRCKIYPNI